MCVCVLCAGGALVVSCVLGDPSEEGHWLTAPAGVDCEVAGSTWCHLALAPPAGEESDCGTDGGGGAGEGGEGGADQEKGGGGSGARFPLHTVYVSLVSLLIRLNPQGAGMPLLALRGPPEDQRGITSQLVSALDLINICHTHHHCCFLLPLSINTTFFGVTSSQTYRPDFVPRHPLSGQTNLNSRPKTFRVTL